MSGPVTRPGETHGASPVALAPSPGAGTGDVVGPASSTDNAVAVWDGTTGKLLQNVTNAPQVESGGDFVVDPLDTGGGLYFGPYSGTVHGFIYADGGTGLNVNANDGTLRLGSDSGVVIGIEDVDEEIVIFSPAASAVNELTITNAASLSPPIIAATGDDTNIGIWLKPKGSGILYIGDGTAGIDYTLNFVGADSTGVLAWMEDEDYFRFSDDVFLNTSEALYLRATTQKIHSSGASTLNINAPTLVLNDANPGDIVLGDGTQRDMYPQTDLKIDLGTSAKRYNEGWIHQLHVQQSVANVSSPPTDAELDSAFGTPATLGRGFIGTVDDNDADATMWICVTSDASWYYVATTKAV